MTLPRIQKLPRTLSNQIAAGEVVERPASVVKELLENAFDAGADDIMIELEAGGTRHILVRDNGHGIHPADLELALDRHSTSKLRAQSDLDCISSLGFRGEALASIAAVARFQLNSRIQAAETGWSLAIDPVSNYRHLQPAAHPAGTSVAVDDLFQPTPARKKFLRAERTEFLHVHEMVKRLALSRLANRIRLVHNNKMIMNCRDSSADPKQRVAEIMGKAFLDNAVRVNCQQENTSIWGWLGQPHHHRSQSDMQYLFINGRLIRDPRLARSIRMIYADRLPQGRYATWILYLEVDPVRVDINVHPTKSEVRFKQPRDIHNFIHSSLRVVLDEATSYCIPPASDSQQIAERPLPPYSPPALLSRRPPSAANVASARSASLFAEQGPVLLLAGRYLIVERGEAGWLIDALALWRVLLEQRLQMQFEQDAIKHRPLLVPVMQQVTQAHFQLLETHQHRLERLGVHIRLTGINTVQIKAIPALLEEGNIADLLTAIGGGLKWQQHHRCQLPWDHRSDVPECVDACCEHHPVTSCDVSWLDGGVHAGHTDKRTSRALACSRCRTAGQFTQCKAVLNYRLSV